MCSREGVTKQEGPWSDLRTLARKVGECQQLLQLRRWIDTGFFMDAVTGGGSVPPATLDEKRQTKGRAPVKAAVRLSNPLQRYISLVEHSTPPGSGCCRHCLTKFPTNKGLRAHVNVSHTKDLLFVCDDTVCGYQTFSFVAMVAHDRRHHLGRRMFSVGFRQSELSASQPVLYEIVPLSEEQTNGFVWSSPDHRQRLRCLPDQVGVNIGSNPLRLFHPISFFPLPDKQVTGATCERLIECGRASANNSLDLSQVQRSENISRTLPPESYQSTPNAAFPSVDVGQARTNIDPIPYHKRSENRDCAPLPPLPEQGTRSTGEACPGDELTGDFRDIYHTFKQRLEALQPDPNLYI